MIDPLQAIFLSLVQGVTEFLPVSSSAHLILVPSLLGWPDQGLAFDVAVHMGTLVAVLFFFRRDLCAVGGLLFAKRSAQASHEAAHITGMVMIASVPVFAVAVAIEDLIETVLRHPQVIASTTAVFGVLLWSADRFGRRHRALETMRWSDALCIGLAQALALVPGVSRAGITITAALALGLDRQSAVKFSFMLAIPVIFAAGVFKGVGLVLAPVPVAWNILALGTVLSALSAYAVLVVFLRVIERTGMLVFVIYRLVLAAFLFYWFQST